jgi:hypothetical protein
MSEVNITEMFGSDKTIDKIDKLARFIAVEDAAVKALEEERKDRSKKLDASKEQLYTMLKEAGMDSCKLECGLNPRATIKMKYYSVTGISSPEMFEWLGKNDLADIIKPTVNFNTLQSTLKTFEEQGGEIPSTIVTKSPTLSITMGGKSKFLANLTKEEI